LGPLTSSNRSNSQPSNCSKIYGNQIIDLKRLNQECPLASDKDRLVLGDDLAFGKKKESLGVDL